MATTLTHGYTFSSTELITNAKLHALVDSATITGSLYATADGGGIASQVGITNVSNVATNSTGVGSIKFKDATDRDSTGFLKIFIGADARYIPFFSAITT
jgi:hypothetical protein